MKTYFDESSHPVVEITVSGMEKTATFPALIDTGFDGYRSLPLSLALPLGLKLFYHTPVTLADGSVKEELLFKAKVKLNKKWQEASVFINRGSVALLGTKLLENSKLLLDFPNQKIQIQSS